MFFCLIRFFNLGFLEIIQWGQGCSSLFIIKKWLVYVEHALSSGKHSTPFGRRVRRLLMTVGSLSRWNPKHHATLYTVGQRVLASMTQRSSNNNISPPPSFSLSFTSKCVLALKNYKVVLNRLIVSNVIYDFSISSINI
jgi:hypothetical protein